MVTQIQSLDQFRSTFVYRFPTRPVRDLRVVRVSDGSVVAICPKGRIYVSCVSLDNRRKAMVRELRSWGVYRIARGLELLGVATKQLAKDMEVAAQADQRRREAQYALMCSADMEKLGVKLTAAQRLKLKALAKEVGP